MRSLGKRRCRTDLATQNFWYSGSKYPKALWLLAFAAFWFFPMAKSIAPFCPVHPVVFG
jgi:hypothetical protein